MKQLQLRAVLNRLAKECALEQEDESIELMLLFRYPPPLALGKAKTAVPTELMQCYVHMNNNI